MTETDLTLTRILRAPRHLVWRCWTEAEHLRHWFAPDPVTVSHAEVDPRPGGRFLVRMRMPDGAEVGSPGAVLEAVKNERFAFTDALEEGWKPSGEPFFSAIITLEDHPEGTLYTALARHKDAADCQRHAEMGFHEGWGTVADQLGRYAASLQQGARQ